MRSVLSGTKRQAPMPEAAADPGTLSRGLTRTAPWTHCCADHQFGCWCDSWLPVLAIGYLQGAYITARSVWPSCRGQGCLRGQKQR